MKRFLFCAGVLSILFGLAKNAGAQSNQTLGNGVPTAPINFPGTGCTYFWVNSNPGIGLPASGMGNIASFIATNNSNTPVTATITATPEPTGYAFIANYGDGTVSVINTATNTIVHTIKGRSDAIGVGVNSNFERFIVSNSGANSFSVVNTVTDSLTTKDPDSTVYVGAAPWGLIETPDGETEYVANSQSNTISIVNPATLKLIGSIPVQGGPKGLALSTDSRILYVTNSLSNSISVISVRTNTVLTTITLTASPLGVATSPDGKTLYVTTAGTPGAVLAIGTATNMVLAKIPVGDNPTEVAVTGDSNLVYVTNSGSNNVSLINTTSNKVISTIGVGSYPFGICITPDGSRVYVTNENSNNVSVINTLTNAVVATIAVGKQPTSFGSFIIGSGSGCSSLPVKVTITVNPGIPPPLIIAGSVTGTMNACFGMASVYPDVQQFALSGTNLTTGITATAPPGFEVSLSPEGGYAGSINIGQSGGAVSTTIVYARLASSASVGKPAGNVVLSTTGGNSKNVAITGNVNPLPMVNPVAPQTVNGGSPTTAIHFTGSGNGFNWVNDTPGIGLPAVGTGDIASFTAVNNGSAPITATITVTPAFSNFAYVANFGDGTVTVIDVTGNAVVTTVPVGTQPYAVLASPDGSKIYVSDEYANTVLVMNAATNMVIATLPVGTAPSGLAISPDGTQLYVVNNYSNNVLAINTLTYATLFNTKVGSNPQALALSPDGNTIYVTNSVSNTVSAINTTSGAITATIAVGGAPSGVAVSADGSLVYVANSGANTISVISVLGGTVSATIPAGKNPQGVVLSPDGSRLYVTNNNGNSVSVINTGSNSVIATVAVDRNPFGESISPDGSVLFVTNAGSDEVTVINTTTNTVVATIPVGLQPDSFGNFITSNKSGCVGPSITFIITVNPNPVKPTISTSGSPSALTTVYGTPSTSTVFTVSGVKLTAGILITPPAGFEVSNDDVTFKPAITVGTGGKIAPTTVYIRLAATTPVGSYPGKIALTSAGAPTVDVTMPVSTVTPAGLTIKADDKSKTFGKPNPLLTASYAGFVNNETAANLAVLPVLTTTAVTTSPVGQYPITANGASSPNYTIIAYLPGVLSILPAEQSILIPNAFTPNGDGINDTWNIKFLSAYVNCSVDIFNRWGEKVYSSTGYSVPWDGSYKGTALPTGTYYYIINLKNGQNPLSGFVAIIR